MNMHLGILAVSMGLHVYTCQSVRVAEGVRALAHQPIQCESM